MGGVLRLNFHDRFAIVQNPIDEPTLSNVARFDRFQNSAGVTAFVELNDLKFVFGYDHFTFDSLDSEFDSLDRREEQFYGSASLRFTDAVTAGLDGNDRDREFTEPISTITARLIPADLSLRLRFHPTRNCE